MKQRTWLYHQTKPWQIFDITPEEQAELEVEGWVDTPAKLVPVDPDSDQDELTPVDLPEAIQKLLEQFLVKPEDLTKEQLIELGRSFGVDNLKMTMKEATLIKRIQDSLDGNS